MDKLGFTLIEFKTVFLKKVTTSTVNVENIEDTDEYLKIINTTIQVNIKRKAKSIDKANNIPR